MLTRQVSSNDPHWCPVSSTDIQWPPLSSIVLYWSWLSFSEIHQSLLSPTDPWPTFIDLYWVPLTPAESHLGSFTPIKAHLPQLSHSDLLLTHDNDSYLTPTTLNNSRLSLIRFKGRQSNQFCLLLSMYTAFPQKITNHAL